MYPVRDGVYEEGGDDSLVWFKRIGCKEWFHLHCSRIPPRQHAKLERVDFIYHLLTLKNVTLQRCGYLCTI